MPEISGPCRNCGVMRTIIGRIADDQYETVKFIDGTKQTKLVRSGQLVACVNPDCTRNEIGSMPLFNEWIAKYQREA